LETRSTPAPCSATIPSEIRRGSFEAGSAESLEGWFFRPAAKKHRKNGETFGSCPLRCKTLVFPGFFAYWANCFDFLCLSMHVHACRCCPWRNHRLVRCLGPQKHFSESSSESPELSPNPRFSWENMWFCSGGCRIRISCLRNKKDRAELSHRSSNRPTNTMRSRLEVLLAGSKPSQTGKRSVPSGIAVHPFNIASHNPVWLPFHAAIQSRIPARYHLFSMELRQGGRRCSCCGSSGSRCCGSPSGSSLHRCPNCRRGSRGSCQFDHSPS
jgi:hypothetical protein